MADLIAFNDANPDLEEPPGFQDQSRLIASEATTGRDQTYFNALAADIALGRSRGIDAAIQMHNLDALVLPSQNFALNCKPPSIAGYPMVTVPLGFYPDNVTVKSTGPTIFYPAPGIPFGLSFFASKFSEFKLISFAFAYEQSTHTRLQRKAFPAAIPKTQLVDVIGKS